MGYTARVATRVCHHAACYQVQGGQGRRGRRLGQGQEEKWSKGKVNNLVLFDKNTFDKLLAEVPKYKMITPSILSDRLRINGSLARKAIGVLIEKDLIRPVCKHSKQYVYTRATNIE